MLCILHIYFSPSCKVSIIFSIVNMADNLIYWESFLWEMEWWRRVHVFLLFPSRNESLGCVFRETRAYKGATWRWEISVIVALQSRQKEGNARMKLETIILKNAFPSEHIIGCLDIYGVPCTLSSFPDQCGSQQGIRSFSSGHECLCIFIQVPAVFWNFCVGQSLQRGFRDVQIVSLSAKRKG